MINPQDAPTPRDAASLILLRLRGPDGPSVLMGRRGGGARFMPSKIVFPGGALDADDTAYQPRRSLAVACDQGLRRESAVSPAALALAALRETFEETGLAIGAPDPDAKSRAGQAPDGWREFLSLGLEPRLDALKFVFRAVTPPNLKIRFDARFFLADISDVHGDPDDFSAASGELSDLGWLPIARARAMETPFITGIILEEIAAMTEGRVSPGAPFFRHEGGQTRFDLL